MNTGSKQIVLPDHDAQTPAPGPVEPARGTG